MRKEGKPQCIDSERVESEDFTHPFSDQAGSARKEEEGEPNRAKNSI